MTIRVFDSTARGNRIGLKITGQPDVQVVGCDFSDNSEAGILITDDLESLLARCICPLTRRPSTSENC